MFSGVLPKTGAVIAINKAHIPVFAARSDYNQPQHCVYKCTVDGHKEVKLKLVAVVHSSKNTVIVVSCADLGFKKQIKIPIKVICSCHEQY